MSDAGKGDVIRPMFITNEEYDRRWQQTFGSTEVPVCPVCLQAYVFDDEGPWVYCDCGASDISQGMNPNE